MAYNKEAISCVAWNLRISPISCYIEFICHFFNLRDQVSLDVLIGIHFLEKERSQRTQLQFKQSDVTIGVSVRKLNGRLSENQPDEVVIFYSCDGIPR